MRTLLNRQGVNFIFSILFFSILLFALFPDLIIIFLVENTPSYQSFITFKTILLGIVLETFPFLILGILVSSLMQQFVSEAIIRKFTPKNPWLGIPFACMLAFLFPVCECGLIPIVKRLINKGMSLYIGIVFILVGPIINPVVIAATYTAFRGKPELIFSRIGLALFVGTIIGIIVYKFVKGNPLKENHLANSSKDSVIHTHTHTHIHQEKGNHFLTIMDHAGKEFFDMGKYVMIGSILTAGIQTFLPRGSLVEIGQGEISSHIFMIVFAYILSICSTSDAFVASSFAGTFSAGSIVTFLVFGPMLDFKSTLMLLSVFKYKFVLLLSALIVVTVLFGAILLDYIYL
ncbi:MAG TPA: permease [Candidatus Paenibacillus intestinavium]|nr:permease [Candidatus Paenibacillus intestinavium]